MEIENYSISPTYVEMAEKVIEEHEDLHWIKTADVRIDFISSGKAKKAKNKLVFGECMKVKDIYKLYIPYDFLIIVYEPNIEQFTIEQIEILLYHELLHVGVDEKNGEPIYNINPHDIEDFKAVIDRYGLEWADG